MRIAIVITRYGDGVVGGAESEAREYAQRLVERGHQVTVLATCVRDLATFNNEERAGVTSERGVTVERFLAEPRDHLLARRVQHAIDSGFELPERLQRAWTHNTGYSPDLLVRIDEIANDADVLLFAGYLFTATVDGALRHPDKSVLLPLLHDEPNARFRSTGEVLHGVGGLIFNTEAERRLAQRLWGDLPRSEVVGSGLDPVTTRPDARAHRARRGIDGDVVVYAGRREAGKNFPLLVQAITTYNLTIGSGAPVTLVTMGSGDVRIPPSARPFVQDIGFVTGEEKLAWMDTAVAVVNLSVNESFSYVVMEGWTVATPSIVHADCEVTREACAASGGGLWVRSTEEFGVAVDRLRSDTGLRSALGEAGRRYVTERYSWPAVLDRLEGALSTMVGAPA